MKLFIVAALLLAPIQAHAEIKGFVDDVSADGTVSGWACLNGSSAAVKVHASVAGDNGEQGAQAEGSADKPSEEAVSQECNDSKPHRFEVSLDAEAVEKYRGHAVNVTAISSGLMPVTLATSSGKPLKIAEGKKNDGEDAPKPDGDRNNGGGNTGGGGGGGGSGGGDGECPRDGTCYEVVVAGAIWFPPAVQPEHWDGDVPANMVPGQPCAQRLMGKFYRRMKPGGGHDMWACHIVAWSP